MTTKKKTNRTTDAPNIQPAKPAAILPDASRQAKRDAAAAGNDLVHYLVHTVKEHERRLTDAEKRDSGDLMRAAGATFLAGLVLGLAMYAANLKKQGAT